MRLPPFPQHTSTQGLAQSHPAGTLVKIASGSNEELEHLSLLLAAMSISHAMEHSTNSLLVSAEDVEEALYQWQLYAKENSNWPLQAPEPMPGYSTTPSTMLLMVLLALFYAHTGPWQEANPWFSQGAVDSRAILENRQWWRLVTALTLHADSSHLAGNILAGGVVFHLLCRLTGHGAGWLLILFSATLANWLNIILRNAPHLSVGLSTAVFSAIGLLSGLQQHHSRRALFKLLVPVGAGIGLLAMLGLGGERTDLGAHLFGFVCGLLCGLVYRFWQVDRLMRSTFRQHLAFTIAAFIVLFSWRLAKG